MGMFDSVICVCPNCHGTVEFQSKAGDCSLNRFFPSEVPLDIANDVSGKVVSCDDCGELYRIKIDRDPPVGTVRMILE